MRNIRRTSGIARITTGAAENPAAMYFRLEAFGGRKFLLSGTFGQRIRFSGHFASSVCEEANFAPAVRPFHAHLEKVRRGFDHRARFHPGGGAKRVRAVAPMLAVIHALFLKQSVQVKAPPFVLRDRVFLAVFSKEEKAPISLSRIL
jgi:hypothetical protein